MPVRCLLPLHVFHDNEHNIRHYDWHRNDRQDEEKIAAHHERGGRGAAAAEGHIRRRASLAMVSKKNMYKIAKLPFIEVSSHFLVPAIPPFTAVPLKAATHRSCL